MDVITGGRDCPINSNKHTLQLKKERPLFLCFLILARSQRRRKDERPTAEKRLVPNRNKTEQLEGKT